ncbi:MAG TPA: hypothetical protein VHV51_24495 [Polyangiaceae bacterium]|nr:hypothetical protein [Polyangiaceae bacterium]
MHSRLISVAALVIGCGGGSVVSVLPARAPTEAERAPPLRVAVDATSTHLPLAVSGASVSYGDVDRALAQSIEHALSTTKRELAESDAHALGLSIELVDAHAEYTRDRLVVRMGVRATLRQSSGNVYLAQTHAHASASAMTSAERGAPVVLECADSIGRQLSGWLAGMDLH